MSNVCCKEFKGWCKSFTKTEVFLCLVQASFLIVCIGFMTFLILHLMVCSDNKQKQILVPSQTVLNANNTQITDDINSQDINKQYASTIHSVTDTNEIHSEHVTDHTKMMTQDVTENSDIADQSVITTSASTLDKRVKCTWKPSQKTEALTHYYENNKTLIMTSLVDKNVVKNQDKQVAEDYTDTNGKIDFVNDLQSQLEDMKLLNESSDGEEIIGSRKDFILALVKIKPPQDITFGCTLTIITEHWTLTAASCIEAIEEVDSLDSFVMMQGHKEDERNIHPLADVMIHPQYQGVNLTYDLAALKSESTLVKAGGLVVTLPSIVDYFLITIGERLSILGYGRFRNIDKNPLTRSVREVSIHRVPLAQCPAASTTWALRHLAGGAPLPHGACGAAPLCAGALRSRTAPCNYCSGTPLLMNDVLLGVMSDNQHCGLSCEPTLFVNLALVRDWLDSVLLK